MAGSPIRRARREAAAAAAAGPVVFIGADGTEAPPAPKVRGLSVQQFRAELRKPHVPYSAETAELVVLAVALNVDMDALHEESDFPSRRSLHNWKLAHPAFAQAVDDARRHRADSRADRIDSILAAVETGQLDPQAAKVLFEGHKWLMSKESPTKFAEVSKVEMTGRNGGPVDINNIGPGQILDLARFYSLIISRADKIAIENLGIPPMIEGKLANE